ncbi:uncharacterized protein [Watersipora subatra]
MELGYQPMSVEGSHDVITESTIGFNVQASDKSVIKDNTNSLKSVAVRQSPVTSTTQAKEFVSSHNKSRKSGDLDPEDVVYSVFFKLEDVDNYIMEQEIFQTTKFVLNRMCKGFGQVSPDVASQKKQRVKWIASGVKFMGRPFLLIGDKRYDCRHGKDKNVAKKFRYNEKRKSLVSSGEQQRINKIRQHNQLKKDCPAKIQIRDILVYTDFGVEGCDGGEHSLPSLKDPTNSDSYVKHNAQRRLRDRTSARIRTLLEKGHTLQTERQFHVSFPKLCAHKGHDVGQAAGGRQRVDRRVIEHIHKLVSEGVIHIDHMKARIDEFVTQLFSGKPMPEKDNRRYYPFAKDISNHIQKSMASLMSSEGSTGHLQQLYESLRKENPADLLFYTPSGDAKNRLLYIHQTAEQQLLLLREATSRCLLDVKYRDKKSSLPMYLVSVHTDTGLHTVATMILENQEDLEGALMKLKRHNPSWAPAQWTVPTKAIELERLFPGAAIISKDSQMKPVKSARKRSKRSLPPSEPPKSPGETMRELLAELHQLSYQLPVDANMSPLINSLDAVRQQAKALIPVIVSTVTVTSKDCSVEESSKNSLCKTLKSNATSCPVWEWPEVSKTTQIVPDGTTSSAGLGSMAPIVDQLPRSQHGLLIDPQASYITSPPHILSSSLVPSNHSSSSVLPQHVTSSALGHPSASTMSHGIFNMAPASNLSLHVGGMLTDSYHMHNRPLYSHPPSQHRHYLEVSESQSFVQHLTKSVDQ